MKANSILKRKPGESELEFLNRVNEAWEEIVKAKAKEEGAFYEELRKEKQGPAASQEKTREALIAILNLRYPETDLSAVQGKIKAMDEFAAMKAVMASPRFGLPGPSWR